VPLAILTLVSAIKIPGSPYSFSFFSNERNEPAHVHVILGDCEAKFWISPVSLASNHGYASHELNKIQKLVRQYEQQIQSAWDAHFSNE
jgi:hypothetical protein